MEELIRPVRVVRTHLDVAQHAVAVCRIAVEVRAQILRRPTLHAAHTATHRVDTTAHARAVSHADWKHERNATRVRAYVPVRGTPATARRVRTRRTRPDGGARASGGT